MCDKESLTLIHIVGGAYSVKGGRLFNILCNAINLDEFHIIGDEDDHPVNTQFYAINQDSHYW